MALKILSWNAQSIGKENKDIILDHCHENSIDIICIQETWLQPHMRMNFRNYNVIRKDRTNGTKGGVAPLSQIETTIDLIMTSPNIVGITSICIPSGTLLFSDQSPIHMTIESNRQTNSRSFSASHGNRFRFQVKWANWSHFKYNLNLIPIKNILTTDTFIDDRILLFQNKLLQIAKTSMPFTASTNKRVKSSIW